MAKTKLYNNHIIYYYNFRNHFIKLENGVFILMMYFTRNNPRILLNQLREKEDENFKLKNTITVIKEV